MKLNMKKLGRETVKSLATLGLEWAAIDATTRTLTPLTNGNKAGEVAVAVASVATGMATGYVVRDALDKLDDIIIVKGDMSDIPLDDEEDFNFEEEECE